MMAEHKNYGYEPNYELDTFDSNIYQNYSNTCAIRSQEIILRDYGKIIPQEELMEYAAQNGWYDPDGGTNKYDLGNLLDACGVPTSRVEGATIYDIIAELRAGHRVIVSVDANELWIKKEPNLLKRLFGELDNRANDAMQKAYGIEGANHALIVAGVNVDVKDPAKMDVVIIDPGTGDVCVRYHLEDFQDAWDDGNRLMVATSIPAPYQYNYTSHLMEPSGFDTPFLPSMSTMPGNLTNRFHLADSYYDDYADYVPPYGLEASSAISEPNYGEETDVPSLAAGSDEIQEPQFSQDDSTLYNAICENTDYESFAESQNDDDIAYGDSDELGEQ